MFNVHPNIISHKNMNKNQQPYNHFIKNVFAYKYYKIKMCMFSVRVCRHIKDYKINCRIQTNNYIYFYLKKKILYTGWLNLKL